MVTKTTGKIHSGTAFVFKTSIPEDTLTNEISNVIINRLAK